MSKLCIFLTMTLLFACNQREAAMPQEASVQPAIAHTGLPAPTLLSDKHTVELSGVEILEAFSDVRDDAEVQDSVGSRAINYWYSDGRFFNRWSNGENSGEVTGTWRVENGQRCVTILTGLPNRINQETCGPIFRRGDKFLSFNPDGSIHGMHTLSPLP